METKADIRKRILAVRNRMTAEARLEKSQLIIEKLSALKEYREAAILLGFIGYGSEVETLSFLEKAVREGKKVFCPVAHKDGTMEFFSFRSRQNLAAGYKNIPEPCLDGEKFLKTEKQALLLMPGVAFDKSRNRIGYGKGFYDRYLESFKPVYSAGLCFSCQITETIPAKEHDFIPDIVITEDKVYNLT